MSDGNGTAPPSPPPQPGTFEFEAWVQTVTDPWALLAAMRQLDSSQRAGYLNLFRDLCVRQPRLERDSLAEAGKDVWHYRIGTFRDELRDAARGVQQGDITIEQPSVVSDTWIADMVYRRGQSPPVQYVKYDFDTGALSLVPDVEVEPAKYRPPYSMLLDTGSILLPSGAEEYGSDEQLLADLRAYVTKYVAFNDMADPFIGLLCFYVFMTWVYDRFSVLPYLRAIGDFGTGKSRLLQAVGSVCYRGALTGGATTAAPIFRMITRFRPTLVFDEADFGRSDLWDDMTKILNVGYQRGYALLRAERSGGEGSQFDVQGYDVFSPKILATRRRFNDGALESRCLTQTMPLIKELPDYVPLSLEAEFYTDSQLLRNKLLLWRLRSWEHVQVDPYRRFKGVEPRVNQVIQPLLACLSPALQGEVLALVHDLAKRTASERSESLEGAVAQCLLDEWRRSQRPERLSLKRVADALRTDLGETKISERKIGDIIGRVFGIRREKHGGITWVYMTPAAETALRTNYSIDEDGPTEGYGAVTKPPAPGPIVNGGGPMPLPKEWFLSPTTNGGPPGPGPQHLPPGW